MSHNVLVVGAHGVVGGAVSRHLVTAGVRVTTLSRRAIAYEAPQGQVHLQADLLDLGSLDRPELSEVTHLVYAGYTERGNDSATVAINAEMITNTLRALERAGAKVERIVLIGGGKSYGEHLGPYKTPAKESDPRFLGPILYNPQEDAVQEAAARFGGTFTVLRPDGVIGYSASSPMNILTGVAAFAALSKHEGVPLRFPGSLGAWNALHQATDSRLLASGVAWALASASAANEVFNITNGDQFRWRQLWLDVAEFFETPIAEPQPLDLPTHMAEKGAQWEALARDNDLVESRLASFAAWPFVHGWLRTDYDMVQSTVKIRQAGFGEAIDTHQSFLEHLTLLRERRLIP